MNNIIDRGKI